MALPFQSPQGFEQMIARSAARKGHWLVFRGEQLLVEIGPPSAAPTDDPRVRARPSWARLPFGEPEAVLPAEALRFLSIGRLAGSDFFAAEIPAETAAPPGMSWEGLRALFSVLEDAHFALAGRALQLVDWDRTHQFCGRCATPTVPKEDEHVRVCPSCRLSAYPRVAPAVMALVRRGREILLGRGPHFPAGMYSALAGFVEPGESLEQCVAREVAEEVGIQVANLAYFTSQPWPFPHSLMIAFVCDWAGGEISPREGEIEAANWFDIFQLPKLPSRISIARRLIDAVAGEMRDRMRPEFKPGVQP